MSNRFRDPGLRSAWRASVVWLAVLATSGVALGCSPSGPTFECSTGEWDNDADSSTACEPHSVCAAGTFVQTAGTADADRTCAACPSGTFSTTTNVSTCTPWTVCSVGSVVGVDGTATSDRSCVPCATGLWDHDADVTTACVAKTVCVASSFVVTEGDGTADRECAGCSYGFFTDVDNAPACTPWTVCGVGFAEVAPGGQAFDRACTQIDWLWSDQFGTTASDRANAVTVDASGNSYVVGTAGMLAGQTVSFGVFVRKYAPDGAELWTRQFSSGALDVANAVVVDANGDVTVVGSTTGTLPGQTSSGNDDAFARKYDADGNEVWTLQFGTADTEIAHAAAVDSMGNVAVAGYTSGAFAGFTNAGNADAFVTVIGADGSAVWTRQFGTAGLDEALAVAVDTSDAILVAGRVFGALPGQAQIGGRDAYVRKYDAAGVELWTRQFGTTVTDAATAVAVDADDRVVVAGNTGGALPGQVSAGGTDAYVMVYDAEGTEVWTRQFGSAAGEVVNTVAVDPNGKVVIGGGTTGSLGAGASSGTQDAFLRAYDATGVLLWTRQFGSLGTDEIEGAAFASNGDVVAVGRISADGYLAGEVSSGGGDAFVVRWGP